jgi:nitrous oxide reductase accessory protein NosL
MHGPFFGTDEKAAEYCGMSLTTFKRHKAVYALEKKAGPNRRQYAASDLDAFMENPERFRKITHHKIERLTMADLGM